MEWSFFSVVANWALYIHAIKDEVEDGKGLGMHVDRLGDFTQQQFAAAKALDFTRFVANLAANDGS
ncbi:hypothetical protein BH18ACI5_BH18ACI5_17290 [soil metagenome]